MSISLPEFTVTSKQFFTNGVQRVEMRVFDGKLYVMAHEGGSIAGGTLVLDPLPPEATLGAFGDVTAASAVTGEYTLAVNSEDYTEEEIDDLALELQAELEAQFPGTSISVTVVAGSLKASYTIVPEDVSSWDMTAAVSALDTQKQTMLKNAASKAGMTDLATQIESGAIAVEASQLPTLAAQVLPGIVKSVSFDSGTLTVETLGAFTSMAYSVDDGASWGVMTPAASGSAHTHTLANAPSTVRVRLFNAAQTKIAQMISVIVPAVLSQVVLHWPFQTDVTDSTGQYDLLAMSYLRGTAFSNLMSPSNPIPADRFVAGVGQGGTSALRPTFTNNSWIEFAGHSTPHGAWTRFPISWTGDGLSYSFNFCKHGLGGIKHIGMEIKWGTGKTPPGVDIIEVPYLHSSLWKINHPDAYNMVPHGAAPPEFDNTNDPVTAPMVNHVNNLPVDGSWHQCTVTTSFTTSKDTNKFYIDGVLMFEREGGPPHVNYKVGCPSAGNPDSNQDYLYCKITSRHNEDELSYVQDLRIFTTALTDQQVTDLYNATIT